MAKNLQNRIDGQEIDWLVQARDQAGKAFEINGWPSTKVEAFHYTNLKSVARAVQNPEPQHGRAVQKSDIPVRLLTEERDIEAARLIVVNGVFRDDLSDTMMLPAQVTISSFDQALERNPDLVKAYFHAQCDDRDQALFALNTHFFTDGVFIHVPEDVCVKHPIEILSFTEGDRDHMTPTYPRHMFIIEENAEATILEHLAGEHSYLKNVAYDISVANSAKLHHYRWQDEDTENGHLLATTHLTQQENSLYDGFNLTTQGAMMRHEVHAYLEGPHIDCRVNGAYLLKDKQLADTTITVHHKSTDGTSNQSIRGLCADHAKGVFQGKIHVHKDAQRTDGYQLHNAILLDETAEVNTKPELEIYADDVKCSHGATTGQLDGDGLFYLRARGLSEEQAQRLILQAFIAEVIDQIESHSIRQLFTELCTDWLNTRSQ